jgi:16S rRNA (adenine1518-N6/adenine1519-N6)-dimethyltransferase
MATAIITRILPLMSKAKGCMFMTQFEVAQRITALAGSKSYGSLSVFCACHAKSRIARLISPEYFNPKPKVNSATIILEPLKKSLHQDDKFFEFVKAAFSQKRKILANSLSEFHPKEEIINALKSLDLRENIRAEELSLDCFIEIYYILHK